MLTENRTYTLLLLGWLRSSYEKDPESGLYYAGARYQVPRLGSFNSTDPLWWKSPDKTSYHYCANNPVMFVDPDGREVDDPPYTYKYVGVIAGYILEKAGYFPLIKQGGYVMGNTDNAMHIKNNLNVVATNFQINIGNAIGEIDLSEGMPQNAVRHTLWNALMARDLGGKQATRASNSHETGWTLNTDQRSFSYTEKKGSLKNAILRADQVADLLNNIIGRRIGLENPNADNKTLAGKVMEEYHKNGLYTTRINNDKVEVVKTRITKVQYDAAMKEIVKKGDNGLNK